jgi:hypothetical protein
MNCCESKGLHLDIPNSGSQVEGVTASLVGEGGYPRFALHSRNRGSRQKLVCRSD